MSMKKVFICSRYAGDIEINVMMAKKLCRIALENGYSPYAPHLFFTQPGLLDDDVPAQRQLGIDAGHEFLKVCDMMWLYVGDGISNGMMQDIEIARQNHIPIVEIHDIMFFEHTPESKGWEKVVEWSPP